MPITEWNSSRRLMRWLRRKRGATATQLAREMDIEEHTVRALISRLRAADVTITLQVEGRRGQGLPNPERRNR